MTTPQRLYDEAVLNYEGARAELDAAIKRLGYAEGFEAGREFERGEALKEAIGDAFAIDDVTDSIAESFVSAPPKNPLDELCGAITEENRNPPREKTAQELRDEIVERAKADIDDLEATGLDDEAFLDDESYFSGRWFETDFVVNSEKRTVVALVYELDGISGTYNRKPKKPAKGIAKCAPNDCFNAHIGKAIAFRRALGLTVPDEYVNAPAPTEVRVGDVVGYPFDPDDDSVDTIESIEMDRGIMRYKQSGWDEISILFTDDIEGRKWDARIIDDSREEAVR